MKHVTFHRVSNITDDHLQIDLTGNPPLCLRMSKTEASLMARAILKNAGGDLPGIAKTIERYAQASARSQDPAIRHLFDDSTLSFHQGGTKAYRHCLELLVALQSESNSSTSEREQ